jgi:hypothetical protein
LPRRIAKKEAAMARTETKRTAAAKKEKDPKDSDSKGGGV